MTFASPGRDAMAFVRIVCEAMIMVLIAFEPVQNRYLKKFVNGLLAAFILQEFMLIVEAYVIYMNILYEWTAIIWTTYEIVRIFISLSLCYPMALFIGEDGRKLQRFFFVVCGLVAIGAVSDFLGFNNGHSGLNFIAFMLIFLFTFRQYIQLRRQTEGEIPRLKSLMALELALIVLDGMMIVLFVIGGYQQKFLPAIKITMGILQYHKFYMIISVMTYFD